MRYIKFLVANCAFRVSDFEEFEREYQIKKVTDEKIISKYVFHQTGPSWTIGYEGKPLRGLRGKGFKDIHILVINVNTTFHIDDHKQKE
jgi:hypothetical protein